MAKEREYQYSEGRFSFKRSDGKEKCIATIGKDFKIKYEKGCKGAHGVSLADWIERVKPVLEVAKEDATTKAPAVKKPKAPKSQPKEVAVAAAETTVDVGAVETMPIQMLPSLHNRLGIETDEFQAFIKKHDLTEDQITAIVRRLEKK